MYQICLSGAAKGKSAVAGKELAFAVGREVAKRGHSVFTGATTGLPHQAALGAKAEKGQSVGISPAASYHEHTRKYRLPTDAYDVIIFTGLNYTGRDVLLVNSTEALISIGGRIGTWHEFTVALESEKPIAVLEGAGGMSTEFKEFLTAAGRRRSHVIFESDPKILVDRLEEILDIRHAEKHLKRRRALKRGK